MAMVLATPSCKYFFKSDYANLTNADLTTMVETLGENQKRMLAQNEAQRKQMIQTFKQAYSLAQAAEAEGLDKSAKFKQRQGLSDEQLLAVEFAKRNETVNVAKEEADAYYAAHKDAFEADFRMISEGRKQPPTDEQKESIRSQWSEMKVMAEKARKAGLAKDQVVLAQQKFRKADLLANLYTELLEERFKLSEEEKKKYIAEHPEADVEKIKQKAQGLLDRVKKGESFEKIADEFNDDGTRGRGGDLDWFGRGRMDPVFENAAFLLDKGKATDELVKSSFGFHIIRVDDKRKVSVPALPSAPGAPPSATAPQTGKEQAEEVHARHIFLSTQEADTFEKRLIQDKIKRAMEDATLKFPVNAPNDFKINVAGFDPNRIPNLGGGSKPK